MSSFNHSFKHYHKDCVVLPPREDRHLQIVEQAPEGESHTYSSDESGEYLTYLLGDRAKVRHAKPITIPGSASEPEPDIAVVQRLGRIYRQHHPYPENVFWVMEYSNSSLSKDLEIKPKVYAAAGIPEYWVVNLQAMTLIVMRIPTPDGYQSQVTLTEGIVTSLAFPDIEIEVKRLLNP